MATALTRARQARLPSPWTEAVDFLCFSAKPCTPMLNFFARSGPKIEKIDSPWTGRGIGNEQGDGIACLAGHTLAPSDELDSRTTLRFLFFQID